MNANQNVSGRLRKLIRSMFRTSNLCPDERQQNRPAAFHLDAISVDVDRESNFAADTIVLLLFPPSYYNSIPVIVDKSKLPPFYEMSVG